MEFFLDWDLLEPFCDALELIVSYSFPDVSYTEKFIYLF